MATASDETSTAILALRQWLAPFERVFVLTGAGISTASGIPDYATSKNAQAVWLVRLAVAIR